MVAIACTYMICTIGWACTRLSDIFVDIDNESDD